MLKRLICLCVLLCGALLAQQVQGYLTNQRVVDLLSVGVRTKEIFRIIATAPQANFNLSPRDTDALIKLGVSEELIKAMAARERGVPFTPSVASAPSAVSQGSTPSSAQMVSQATVPMMREPDVPLTPSAPNAERTLSQGSTPSSALVVSQATVPMLREPDAAFTPSAPNTERTLSQGFTTSSALVVSQAAVPMVPQVVTHGAMANDAILKMVKSGLGDGLIIRVIQSQPGEYSTSPDDLVSLKLAGVPETVLGAMVAKTTLAGSTGVAGSLLGLHDSGATPVAGLISAGDPNDPLSSHDSGIWMYSRDAEGRPQMVLLERAAYESVKTGGFAAYSLTYGIAKIKSKAVLPGRYAGIRTTDQNVVFYFYFDHKAELDESSFLHTVSNPGQFSLVKLAERKATRETLTGEFGIGLGCLQARMKMLGLRLSPIRYEPESIR